MAHMSKLQQSMRYVTEGGVVIRSVNVGDLETLRVQKNLHRHFFFSRAIITPEAQAEWFASYQQRDDDHMFVIVVAGSLVGSIGLRVQNSTVDLYNLMLWSSQHRGGGYMKIAFDTVRAMAASFYPGFPLAVEVLETNPAIKWYERQGFVSTEIHESADGRKYVVMLCSAQRNGDREL